MTGQTDETEAIRPDGTRLESDRLLRAIEELRALERERVSVRRNEQHFELDRRVEEKAREVFRLAEAADEDPIEDEDPYDPRL